MYAAACAPHPTGLQVCPGVQVVVSLQALYLLGLVFQHLLTSSGHITELEASIVHSLQGHLTVLP